MLAVTFSYSAGREGILLATPLAEWGSSGCYCSLCYFSGREGILPVSLLVELSGVGCYLKVILLASPGSVN